MTDRLLTTSVLASLVVHAAGLAVASAVATSLAAPAPVTVPIEVVSAPPPPARPDTPRPVPPRPTPRPRAVQSAVSPPPRVPIAPPSGPPPNLLDDAPHPAVTETGASAPPPALPPRTAPVVGSPPGMGAPFAAGDLLTTPGPGATGEGDEPGPMSPGTASKGTDGPVGTSTTGLTALARPLGGYQVKPVYPESARRARSEGVTLLRFLVLATGRVGPVTVAESAGDGDLDRAAMDAVKQWHFEPARRGTTAVAVWVTLPVRFALTDR